MKYIINQLIEWVWATWTAARMTPHFVVVSMRRLNGRLYFMHDRPDWFVDLIAELPREDYDDSKLTAIIEEAIREKARRAFQRGRGAP